MPESKPRAQRKGWSLDDVTDDRGRVIGWDVRFRDSERVGRSHRMLKSDGYNKTDANDYGRDHKAGARKREDTVRTRQRFGEFAREDLDRMRATVGRAGKRLTPNSLRIYQQTVEYYIVPFLGQRLIADLRFDDIEDFRSWLARPVGEGGAASGLRGDTLSPKTIEETLAYTRGVLRAAAKRRLIAYRDLVDMCAVRFVADDDDATPDRQPLTWPQVRRIDDAMPRHMRGMVLVQAGIGVRAGELQAITMQNITWPVQVVDDAARRLSLRTARQGWVEIAGQIDQHTGDWRPRLKSTGGRRRIPIGPRVARVLWERTRAYEPVPMPFGDLIFYAEQTHREHRYGYTRTMPKIAARVGAGDPDWPSVLDGERVTSHDCRHHYISALADERVAPARIAAWSGDKLDTIMDHYVHAMPDDTDVPDRRDGPDVEAIERVWERGERAWRTGVADDPVVPRNPEVVGQMRDWRSRNRR
jgi:hypothetical protein